MVDAFGWTAVRGGEAPFTSHYQSTPANGPDRAAIPQGRPVLVVDDDVDILGFVVLVLKEEGYPVETAANGQEALIRVERVRPSLILLDMRMPVMDGWQFARALNQRGIQVPIVVMTAAQDARRWAQEIGAADYLAKPFDLPDLLDAVGRLRD